MPTPADLLIPALSLALIAAGIAARLGVGMYWLVASATAPQLGTLARVRPATSRREQAGDTEPAACDDAETETNEPVSDERPRAPEIVAHLRMRPATSGLLALNANGLAELARHAARGEAVDNAIHRIDETLDALETDGAVVLHEVELDGHLVRRAMIARQGVFVVIARPALWRDSDIDLLARQAEVLADLLAIPREKVRALVVLESRGEPLQQFFGGETFRGVESVARSDLFRWLTDQPVCIDEAVIAQLRHDIGRAMVGANRPTRPVVRNES